MSDRTCPWFENDQTCGEPVINPKNRVALCEAHSIVRRSMDQKNRGELILRVSERGIVPHTEGLTYVAEMKDGTWLIGFSSSDRYLKTKLRNLKKEGELAGLVTVLDGGESLAYLLIAKFSEYRAEKLGDYFFPAPAVKSFLSSAPRSDKFTELEFHLI